jgi:hypothetical protein
VLSMSRMVGGTFGIATLGAIVAGVGSAKIDQRLPQVPAAARQKLTDSLGAGGVTHAPPRIVAATHDAFIAALGTGLKIGAGFALLGALVALALVSNRRPDAPEAAPAEVPEGAQAELVHA